MINNAREQATRLILFDQKTDDDNQIQNQPSKIRNDYRWEVDMSDIQSHDMFKDLPERLCYLKERDHVSMDELSEKTRLNINEIQNYFDGKEDIKCIPAVKIAKVFHVTPGFIKFGYVSDRMDVFWYQIDSLLDINNMTILELSQELGDHYEPWKNITSGRKVPTDREIREVADYFHVDQNEFSKTQLYYEYGFTNHSISTCAHKHQSILLRTMAKYHMKQQDLVKMTGVSNDAIARLVRMVPESEDVDAMVMIANYFGMNPSDLFPEPEFTIFLSTMDGENATEQDHNEYVSHIVNLIWDLPIEKWNVIVSLIDQIIQIDQTEKNIDRTLCRFIRVLSDSELSDLKTCIEAMKRMRGQ